MGCWKGEGWRRWEARGGVVRSGSPGNEEMGELVIMFSTLRSVVATKDVGAQRAESTGAVRAPLPSVV